MGDKTGYYPRKIRFGESGCRNNRLRRYRRGPPAGVYGSIRHGCARGLRLKQGSFGICSTEVWCGGFPNYHDLLGREDIEVVSVCTPTPLHERVTVDAANH